MANHDDPFCYCGYRLSEHPTPPGTTHARGATSSPKASRGLNMHVSDPDFAEAAEEFRKSTMDTTKGKRKR